VKARRQIKILELVRNKSIETQEELAEALQQEGIDVTQATVSRDIKELKLVKVPVGDGSYEYSEPEDQLKDIQTDRMLRIFRECVVSMDYSGQMLVINTLPATADGVAEAIDGLRWQEILGTLAGERIVFVVVKPGGAVPEVINRLEKLMQD
jgi:transcriptional regulator of arginine metabolism